MNFSSLGANDPASQTQENTAMRDVIKREVGEINRDEPKEKMEHLEFSLNTGHFFLSYCRDLTSITFAFRPIIYSPLCSYTTLST